MIKLTLILLLSFLPLITKEGVVKNEDHFRDYYYKGFKEYKGIMSFRESGNNPLAVGRNHYRGLYSFGIQAAKDVNINYDSLFIPEYADSALVRLMRKNWEYLKGYHTCVGCTLRGIKITKAGMLAGAHLRGHAAVAKWIRSDGDTVLVDGNGVKVTDYMKMMENVNLIKY